MFLPYPLNVLGLAAKFYPIAQGIESSELLEIDIVLAAAIEAEVPISMTPVRVAQYFEKDVLSLGEGVQPHNRCKTGRFLLRPGYPIYAFKIDGIPKHPSVH